MNIRKHAPVKASKIETNTTKETSLSYNRIVLKDENLMNSLHDDPLNITESNYQLLMTAINKDTNFLKENEIMDYSLLVFKDDVTNQLILGIVDYIRTYT